MTPRSERVSGTRASAAALGVEPRSSPEANAVTTRLGALIRSVVPPIQVLRPGRLPYAAGLALQDDLVAKRRAGEVPDTLVLLEHDAVVTLGRGADRSHVLLDKARLAARGVELFETGRGGDVTIHSPGQVVGYPILALEGARRDTHLYLRDLEEVMIRAAADFGVEAVRVPGLTGIWAGAEKLGAIGVRLNSGWITSHGFAFNVANDLALFSLIVPCGIVGRGITSLSRLLGRQVAVDEAMDRLASRFLEIFWNDASGPQFVSAPIASEGQPIGSGHEMETDCCDAALHGGGEASSVAQRVYAVCDAALEAGGEPISRKQRVSASRNDLCSIQAAVPASDPIGAGRCVP